MYLNCKIYNKIFKEMIVDLYKSGRSLIELSFKYGVTKITINNT